MLHNIKRIHEGIAYSLYGYYDQEGQYQEVEITGTSRMIIDSLLKQREELKRNAKIKL